MKPRKANKKELAELEATLKAIIKSGGEHTDSLISDAAIAVFDQIKSPNFPFYGRDDAAGKLMVCVYMIYPGWVQTYRWEDGKWIIGTPHLTLLNW